METCLSIPGPQGEGCGMCTKDLQMNEIERKRDGILFHLDGFCRTDIDTGPAVSAEIIVDNCDTVLHGDGLYRALIDARFASNTKIRVNNCNHTLLLRHISSQKAEK